MKKLAIFRRKLGKYSETFVRQNIENLNKGKTVTVSEYLDHNFNWKKPRESLQLKKYPLYLKIPIIYLFLKFHKVGGVVFEFADYALKYRKLIEKMDIPYIVLAHGFDVGRKISESEEYALRLNNLMTAKKILVPSNYIKDYLLKHTNLRSDLISTIPVGVDLKKFKQKELSKVQNGKFLFVGRFVEKKNPLALIYSFYNALKIEKNLILTCIGDGEQLVAAKQFSKVLGIQKSIQFLGSQPSDRVAAELETSQALLQHSVIAEDGDVEGLPVIAMEALATGTPVISTAHSGLQEVVIDGQTGFTCKEWDTETMSENILKISKMNETNYKKMCEQCVIFSKKLSCEHRNRFIDDLFNF